MERLIEHLPGKHDQKSHGRGGTSGGGGLDAELQRGEDNWDSNDDGRYGYEVEPTSGWMREGTVEAALNLSPADKMAFRLDEGPSERVRHAAARELQRRTAIDNHEYLMAFDRDGKLIMDMRGGAHSVSPPPEGAVLAHTIIHSHPGPQPDATFSPSDLSAQASYMQKRGGVVTPSGRYHEVAVPDGYSLNADFADYYAYTVTSRLGAQIGPGGTPDPAVMAQGLRMVTAEAGLTYTVADLSQLTLGEHLPGTHDQRKHGRRFSTGGTHYGKGTEDDPIVTRNVAVAAKALEQGKYVELRSRKEVGTLLDELAENVAEARKMGRNAPNYDLCKVSVPKTNLFCEQNLGIPRVKMPQLKGVPKPGSKADQMVKSGKLKLDGAGEADLAPMFAKYMASKGIGHKNRSTSPEYLKATQRELNGGTVAGIAGAMEQGTFPKSAGRIITTSDGYVVDGHHRWAAQVGLQVGKGIKSPIATTEYDAPITTALTLAHAFASDMGLPTVSMGQNRYVGEGAGGAGG